LAEIFPERFTIATIFDRVAEIGDPFLPVAEGEGQSLDEAIKAVDAQPRKARNFKR
jgi:hypothetical protein